MKKLGFFGEQIRPESELYSQYFQLLKKVVQKFSNLAEDVDYKTFDEFIREGKKRESSFVWGWLEEDANGMITTIKKYLEDFDENDKYFDNLLNYEFDMLNDLLEDADFRSALDAFTARLESMCYDLQVYDEEKHKTKYCDENISYKIPKHNKNYTCEYLDDIVKTGIAIDRFTPVYFFCLFEKYQY